MRATNLPASQRALRIVGVVLLVGVTLVGLPLALVVGSGGFAAGRASAAEASWIAAIATAVLCGVGSLGIIVGLFIARRSRLQALRSQHLAGADVLLRLDDRFRCGDVSDVARRLQDGGSWTEGWGNPSEIGPESEEDWFRVTEYVRLFEPAYVLARDGALPVDLLRATFGYRISQVVRNKRIVAKVVAKQTDEPWVSFLGLWQMVDPESYHHWTEFLKLWQVVDANGFNRSLRA